MDLTAKLILEEGALTGQQEEISLTGQELIVGRDPGADIVIASPLISRRHARFFAADGDYLVEDLGSTNLTFVNGVRLVQPTRLSDGDVIQLGQAVRLQFAQPAAGDQTQLDLLGQTALEVAPASGSETLLAVAEPEPRPAQPPLLVISTASGQPQTVQLQGALLRLGRAPDNDVVISSPIVSSHHAVLQRAPAGYLLRVEPGAKNPMYYNGRPVEGEHVLHDGDLLRIGSQDPEVMVSLSYHWPAEAAQKGLTRGIEFGERSVLQLGRDPGNDVVLDAPIVSRFHAVVERIGQRFRVRDLQSANGTFVNGERVEGETWLAPGDAIRVGPFRFVLGEDQLNRFDETGGLRVEALALNKWVRKDLNLLKDISLVFRPREFIVVVGQSGGGKSTLVDAISGYRPATNGRVLVNGIDVYRHFDAVRNEIGFVPQKDIIHTELTVYQALEYAARLRMPADTTAEERRQRVMEVLDDLDLAHRKDVQISGLSGGQQKRVSIGVELLTKPGLFFLDEPTSGLDPGTETALMQLMRRLADQGRTIILITHATKNVMLADRVLFLARGGYLAWFGPPEEALAFFDGHRSERDRRTRAMEFDAIYALLEDQEKGSAEQWADRYLQSEAYQQYVVQPLAALGHAVDGASPSPQREAAPRPVRAAPSRQISGLRQFLILSSRNLKILTRDRASLILMLAAAPLVAMLDLLLSAIMGRNIFDYHEGSMANAMITLFQPAILPIVVGALAMMREFVKEQDVYKRERLVNLKVLPYVSSKLWVAALLALYQAMAYTGIHYLAFDMPGGVLEFVLMYVTVLLATMAGMVLGLLASAIAPNANAAPLIVVLLIIPQIVLGGALIPMPASVTLPTSSRWAFEALVNITGAGSDLAADHCWELTEEERDALSQDDKEALGCRCLGLSALDPNSCQFPGLGAYYDAALDEPEPVAPVEVGDPPPEPVLASAPLPPADQADTLAVAQFLRDLDAYQQEAARVQADYRAELEAYQSRVDAYRTEAQSYQETVAEWTMKRSAAVSRAEGLLGRYHEDFGWAFGDRDEDAAFWPRILLTWGVQVFIISLLFFVILFAVARKAQS
jgi:ABC transport system ATP-binding/permease protein